MAFTYPSLHYQEQHHGTKSSRDELIKMLNDAAIDYDPQYLD